MSGSHVTSPARLLKSDSAMTGIQTYGECSLFIGSASLNARMEGCCSKADATDSQHRDQASEQHFEFTPGVALV